jgi:hypothetical protein
LCVRIRFKGPEAVEDQLIVLVASIIVDQTMQ